MARIVILPDKGMLLHLLSDNTLYLHDHSFDRGLQTRT